MLEKFILKNLKQLIDKVSDLIQIIPYYYDYKGEKKETEFETKIDIISSIGIEINEKSIKYWIEYLENNSWYNLTEPVYVSESPPQIFIYHEFPYAKTISIEISPYEYLGFQGDRINLIIDLSESKTVETKKLGDKTYLKNLISLPELTIGYYKIRISLKERQSESLLIVVPKKSFNLSIKKTWGLHLNLWSLRGKNIEGDFSLLKEVAEYVKNLGGFISLNPLHFNDPEDIYGISPYSAITRQFKTPMYTSEVEIKEKNVEFFEYKRIWHEKISKLREKFFSLHDESREIKTFKEFRNNLPAFLNDDLKYFAVFCFLREKLSKNWLSWEDKLKNFNKETIEIVYRENSKEVLFYEFLQWLVEVELETLKNYNLCFDLGFGSIKNSFDVWINREIYAFNVEHGAPPDDFNPKGQKWGFPPMIPFKLREKQYLPFIKVLKSNMKNSLLRIDHALGLFRSFWIPEGKSPENGAYIRYPWKELLGIICLESQLNKTAIIGEDLGTGEDWMREELINREISSWKVFYFEKDKSGYREQEQYPESALCSITTHDLPTLKGFWHCKDIELRKKFSIFDDTMFDQFCEERQKDKELILEILSKHGINYEEDMESLLISIIKFLSGTKAKYLLLYPEDLLLMEEQTNFPGTTLEYPNWQKKLPITVNDLLKSPIFKKIETILKEAGRLPENL